MLDIAHDQPARLRKVRTSTEPRRSTPAQKLGTALHCLLLEPDEFFNRYCEPFIPPRGALVTVEDIKAALSEAGIQFKASAKKADLSALVRENLPDVPLFEDAKAAYCEANEGRDEISPDDWARLLAMREAVFAHPAAAKLLSAPGESELSAYWHEPVVDAVTGEQLFDEDGKPRVILCRCRPDYWRHDGIIVDVKKTFAGNAAAKEFARHVHEYRYHVQHAKYLRGSRAALRAAKAAGDDFAAFKSPRAFAFLVVEDDACVVDGVAMGVAVYMLDDDSVALGAALMRQDIAIVDACERSGKWPGYSERVESLSLPPYAFTQAAIAA